MKVLLHLWFTLRGNAQKRNLSFTLCALSERYFIKWDSWLAGPLNFCILSSSCLWAYTSSGLTCSVYLSLKKSEVQELRKITVYLTIKCCYLVFIKAGLTYCVNMLNCTAMCTSASHFFIWYNNSVVLRIRLHIHFKSTTFTSSRGDCGWRLEPPFSSIIPPKQLGMQKSPSGSTTYSEETLFSLLFSKLFLGQIKLQRLENTIMLWKLVTENSLEISEYNVYSE